MLSKKVFLLITGLSILLLFAGEYYQWLQFKKLARQVLTGQIPCKSN